MQPMPINLVCPPQRRNSAKVKVFSDYLVKELTGQTMNAVRDDRTLDVR
jgi:hypothetical protein